MAGSAAVWIIVLAYFAAASGRLDVSGHAIGRDFVNAWTAGQLVRRGETHLIFDPAAFLAAERRFFDPGLVFHFFPYPPTALFFLAPLGLWDYFTAYAVWMVAGLLVLTMAAIAFFRNARDVVLLLLSPASAMNLVLGQNGYVTAAMMIAGFALMARRPLASGVSFGLSSFKPQLGVLVPVALAARRRWTVFAAASASSVVLLVVSGIVFGWETWRAFLTVTVPTQTRMMSVGVGTFQWMTPTPFMSARLLGLGAGTALGVQAVFSAVAVLCVWRAYRRPTLSPVATLTIATILVTPQAFNYDMIPVAASILGVARDAKTFAARQLCGLVWIAPALVVPLNVLPVPIVPVILLLALALVSRRATGEDAAVSNC